MRFYLLILSIFLTTLCDARIHFLHIPKTGGTTLKELLKKNYSSSEIYTYYKINSYYKVNFKLNNHFENPSIWKEILAKSPPITEELAIGHLPFWLLKNKDPDFDHAFCFTILREPVDRVISHYFFANSRGRDLKSPLSLPSNIMCRMLCSDPTKKGEDLLNDCIKTLERMDFIIFQDNYDDDVEDLFKILNLKLSDETIPRMNVTKHRYISEEMKEAIRKANFLDVQLYEYAINHFKN